MEGSGGQRDVGSGCVCICGFEALGSCRWGLPFTCHNPKNSGSVLEILINTKSRRPVLCPPLPSRLTIFFLMLPKASKGLGWISWFSYVDKQTWRFFSWWDSIRKATDGITDYQSWKLTQRCSLMISPVLWDVNDDGAWKERTLAQGNLERQLGSAPCIL